MINIKATYCIPTKVYRTHVMKQPNVETNSNKTHEWRTTWQLGNWINYKMRQDTQNTSYIFPLYGWLPSWTRERLLGVGSGPWSIQVGLNHRAREWRQNRQPGWCRHWSRDMDWSRYSSGDMDWSWLWSGDMDWSGFCRIAISGAVCSTDKQDVNPNNRESSWQRETWWGP